LAYPFLFPLYSEKFGKAKKLIGMKYDHPQSAAATIEGLAFLKRFSREPRWMGEDQAMKKAV
jgi:hypothetical protein